MGTTDPQFKRVRKCGHWDSLRDCDCLTETFLQPFDEWVKYARANIEREIRDALRES